MKSDRLKVIFVHIPKCGGTSIERMLFGPEDFTPDHFWRGYLNPDPVWFRALRRIRRRFGPIPADRETRDAPFNRYQFDGLQHLTALQIRHAMGREAFGQYYRFSIVRHPVRRSLSQFRYMRSRRDLRALIGMNPGDDFLTYLRKTYNRAHVHWQPQISFVNDHFGNRLVDDVVKLEEIEHRMPGILARIGVPERSVPHVNRTDAPARHDLSGEEKDLLRELYADDFVSFGYDMDAH